MIERVDAATIRPLRRAILRPTRPPEASVYDQDDDASTAHFAAYDESRRLIGCVTVFPEPVDDEPRAWRLRGMAVEADLRGSGVGAALLATAVDAVKAAGAPLLWCESREAAQGFYEKYGFVASGDLFDVPVAGPHRHMWLKLDSRSLV
ncbi:MAG: GNAT family N-acetyltransferase [Actinomycetes bacterium]